MFFFCFFCFFFHSQQISYSSPSTRCRDQHVAVIKFTHVHTFDRSVAVAPTCRLRWLVVMLRRNQERMYWHTNLHFTTKYIGKIMSDWNVLHFTPLPDQLLNLQHLQVGEAISSNKTRRKLYTELKKLDNNITRFSLSSESCKNEKETKNNL